MPQYLYSSKNKIWNKVLNPIDFNKKIILFLDYDGTLVSIKKYPSLAVLPKSIYILLTKLVKAQNIEVVLVTGREHREIRKLVPIRNLTIASNHGFRIKSRKEDWILPKAKSLLHEIKKLFAKLEINLNSFPGILVENKEITVTVHYRNVEKRKALLIKKIIEETIKPLSAMVELREGKKVFEIRPKVKWNKGEAVTRILKSLRLNNNNSINIYIGDDLTDEDAFRKLSRNGITIRVGKKRDTSANYFLKNTREVQKFLESICSVKK